jgi:uncharacterized protein
MTAEELKLLFDLKPLPMEGGYYREVFRSPETLAQTTLPERYSSDKAMMTSIYYLLEPGTFSAFHRLKSDEIYHFYLGDPVSLTLLNVDGMMSNAILGSDIVAGQQLQHTVPKYTWQGSKLIAGGQFALMGCTVAPGFDPDDYEHGNWETLLRQYPAHHEIIMKLTNR